MAEPLPADAVWQWDYIAQYRLDERIIEDFLTEKWGDYKYGVKRKGDQFRFWVPRVLDKVAFIRALRPDLQLNIGTGRAERLAEAAQTEGW